MTPNRIVAVLSAVITLALAVLPVVANMDWSSTAGVIAGIVAVLGITLKWLEGWQQHELRGFTGNEVLERKSIVKRRHKLPRPSERPE